MGGLQPWHWIIVIAVFVLLFGAKKLPDAARSLGQSMRIFKSEVKEMKTDPKPEAEQAVRLRSHRSVSTPQNRKPSPPTSARPEPSSTERGSRPRRLSVFTDL